jgi:hypothetical protein
MNDEPVLAQNWNRLKNQPRFNNYFIHTVSSSSGMVLSLAILLAMVAQMPCLGDEFFDATQDSSIRASLFSFRSGKGTNTQIHLQRYEKGKIQELFTRTIGRPVHNPICLTNGVIAVCPDGVIYKLDLRGEFVFVAKPKGFEGSSSTSKRLDDGRIYMTESVPDQQKTGLLERLHVVDISGTEPVLKTKFDITQPLGTARTTEKITVVGETNVSRLKSPEGP